MKKIKNQCGFSTLEMLLILSIIGIFSTVAVPQMARTVDKVSLDYEMKHLYSDLNFARSIGKTSTFYGWNFSGIYDSQQNVEFWIYGKNYSPATSNNRYQIMRQSVTSSPFYRHNLINGVELDNLHSNALRKITFNNQSHYKDAENSGGNNLRLVSKYGAAQIIFDSVGRWRGTYEK